MQFDAAIWDAFDRAKAELASNPSVVSVDLGWKVSNGEIQPQIAVRVYVKWKLPLDEIPPELRIPAEIEGLPTDVITVREQKLAGHDMIGGDKITRIVWGDVGTGSGTLGYIATRKTDNKRVMLSNQHVFRNDVGSPATVRELFQPDISCQSLGSKCNLVGYAVEGQQGNFAWTGDASPPKPHFIDCAIGEIKDASSARGVKKFASIAGAKDISRQLVDPTNSPIKVKKMGATTGLTEGVVMSVNSLGPAIEDPDSPVPEQPLTIQIYATDGRSYDETMEVAPAAKGNIIALFNQKKVQGSVTELPGNKLRFQVPYFSDHGDSGSTIVNAAGEIVGLLYASGYLTFNDSSGKKWDVPLGETRACHIGPVLARLGIRIDPSTVTSAGEPVVDEAEIAVHDRELSGRLAKLECQLGSSEHGRIVSSLVREHGREVVDLVHHRKHVTVCWHRYRGPAFAALLVEMLRQGGRPIPTEHEGVSLTQLLSAMADMLIRHGSPALSADVSQNREWLLQWQASGTTIDELIAALEPEPLLGVAYG